MSPNRREVATFKINLIRIKNLSSIGPREIEAFDSSPLVLRESGQRRDPNYEVETFAVIRLLGVALKDFLQVEQMSLSEVKRYEVTAQSESERGMLSTFLTGSPRPYLIDDVVCLDGAMLELCRAGRTQAQNVSRTVHPPAAGSRD